MENKTVLLVFHVYLFLQTESQKFGLPHSVFEVHL